MTKRHCVGGLEHADGEPVECFLDVSERHAERLGVFGRRGVCEHLAGRPLEFVRSRLQSLLFGASAVADSF